MNPKSVQEAREWLDQLYEDLASDPLYEKSGEEFLNRMEWEIRRYRPELVEAVKKALGQWLQGDHPWKADCALDLIARFQATEYIPVLEQLSDDLRTGRSPWPGYPASMWSGLVEAVLKQLRETQAQAERGTG